MSHNNKTIFQKFSSVGRFLGPINSLAWKFDVQIGENLLIFLYKTKVSFINKKTKDFVFYKGKWANSRQSGHQIFTRVNWLGREKVGRENVSQKSFYYEVTYPKLIWRGLKVHSGRGGVLVTKKSQFQDICVITFCGEREIYSSKIWQKNIGFEH